MDLGDIYHGLNKVAFHLRGSGMTNLNFYVHYVLGWFKEYMLVLYHQSLAYKFPAGFPFLAKCIGVRLMILPCLVLACP